MNPVSNEIKQSTHTKEVRLGLAVADSQVDQEGLTSPEERSSSAGIMCVLVSCTTCDGDEEYGQGRLSASDLSLELKAGKRDRRLC